MFKNIAFLCVAAVLLFVAPAALAQEEQERMMREMEKRLDAMTEHLVRSVSERVLDMVVGEARERMGDPGAHHVEPEPLGHNLRLEFSLEGADKTFEVTTATRSFSVEGSGAEATNEGRGDFATHTVINFELHAVGRVLDSDESPYLIQVEGLFRFHEESGEPGATTEVESMANFNSSVYLDPGETKTLVSEGNLRLTLTIHVDD